MGSLSNLYISRSYQSLIHLESDNTASVDLIQLQDGLGNNLGVSLNTRGDISASGDLTTNTLRVELDTEITGGVDINTYFTASTPAYENLYDPFYTHVVRVTGSYAPEGGIPPTINDVRVGWICNGINVINGIVTDVSGSGTGDVWVTIDGEYPQINQSYTFTGRVSAPVRITGSLEVSNDITASNIQIKGDLFVSGTVHSDKVITTTISSSQIYSSGSNQFGDNVSDTQTIVGQTSISGSLTIDGPLHHRGPIDIIGEVEITGSLKVSNEISSSTISGIGNVEIYSQSVDSRLDYLEGPFSTSVDQRLDSIEFFTSSQEQKNITLASYTASVDTKFNTIGEYTSSMNLYTQSNDLRISEIENYTASLKTAFTASGVDVNFNGNINVVGSINAYEIHTIIESASVIFSSGSNVLGDNVSDTQTLNGTVSIPNTLFVAGVEFIPFSSSTDFRINQKLDSASFDIFSASVDLRIDNLEAWSASLQTNFVTETEYSTSIAVVTGSLINQINTKLDTGSYLIDSASFDIRINTKLDSASFQSYTQSNDTKWNTLQSVTSSLNSFTASQESKDITLASWTGSVDSKFITIGNYTASNDTKWNTIGLLTGSYATTGSNTFYGTQNINASLNVSGSSTYTGRLKGNVSTLAISSQTASMDCSLGNFFNIQLVSGSQTFIQCSNLIEGQTITLKVNQPSVGYGQVNFASNIKFPQFFDYVATATSDAVDIVTFVSFDSSQIYAVSSNNLI